MALNNISELSTTPGSNTDFSGTSILGTGLVSTADDSFRNLGSFLAKQWSDLGGVNTVGGTGDAITITTPTVYTALKTGMFFTFIAGAGNTTAVTLNFDAIGAKAVRKISGGTDVALTAGDIVAGGRYQAIYSSTANAAAGAWVLVTPSVPQFYSSDAGATAAPVLDLYRDSASPAASDVLGQIIFNGRDSAANKQEYARAEVVITDATSASEDAAIDVYAAVAGTATRYIGVGRNAAGTATANAIGLPLGQLSFPAAQNTSSDVNTLDDYEEGVTTPTVTSGTGTFTTVSCSISYTKVGNRVDFSGSVTITNAGTAAAIMIVPLPFTVGTQGAACGGIETSTGAAVNGYAPGAGTALNMLRYDGTTIIASGRTIVFSGSFSV